MSSVTFLEDEARFQRIRDRVDLCIESNRKQLDREISNIAFEDGQQWDADVLQARHGQQSAGANSPVPPRPTLTINSVREPVRQVLNQERAADLGIEITAADDFGGLQSNDDDGEIELREGLVRRIQRESNAQLARSWAYKRAVIAGRGYYLVNTRYLPGPTDDQEVYVDRILNQNLVYIDPSHELPDGSDAEYGFIGTWTPLDKFISHHPSLKSHPELARLSGDDGVFAGMSETYPNWFQLNATNDQKAIFEVSYWFREYEERTIVTLKSGQSYWGHAAPDDATTQEQATYLPADTPEEAIASTRVAMQPVIRYERIAGGNILIEETDWPVQNMPIIQVVGEEILIYDSERRYEGMIQQAQDSSKGKNYMLSKFVELVGLTPIPPLMVDPDQISGYEQFYKLMSTRALPFLPRRSYDDQGRPFLDVSRPPVDPNVLPVAQGIQIFDQAVQATTGGSASERVGASRKVQSARAIEQLQQEDQFNTSHFLDNLRLSVQCEARVINSLLYPIYGKPGRRIRGLTGAGESQHFQISDPQAPSLSTPQAPQSQGPQSQSPRGPKVVSLTKDANFNVAVKVTRSYDTRRQQEAAITGDLINQNPGLMTWFGDLFFKNSDGPGHAEMAKRAKVMLDPRIQAQMEAAEHGVELDPATQAKMAQMQTQLQQAQQMMQELSQEADANRVKIQTETLKQQGETQRHQQDMAQAIQLQVMKDATSIRLAEIQAQIKGLDLGHTLAHESDALNRTQAHEASLDAQAQAHEREMATAEKMHDVTMAEAAVGPTETTQI